MIAALIFVAALQGNPILPPPVPAPNVTVRNEVTVQVPPPDPEATAEMAGWSFQGIIINTIAPTMASWANALLDVPDFYRTTPPDLTYRNSAVRGMADDVRRVAFGFVLLALVVWGMTAVLKGYAGSPGRIAVAAALAAGNLIWWQWGIELNNAINNAIAAPDLPSIARPHLTVPQLTTNPAEAFGPSLLVIAMAVVLFLLLGSMLFRLGMVEVLIVIGALALFCKSTEQSDRFAETYIGMSVGTLFSQVLVVVALKLATVLGVIAGGLAGTLLSLVVLMLARRMPGLLMNRFSQPSVPGIGVLVLLRRAVAKV